MPPNLFSYLVVSAFLGLGMSPLNQKYFLLMRYQTPHAPNGLVMTGVWTISRFILRRRRRTPPCLSSSSAAIIIIMIIIIIIIIIWAYFAGPVLLGLICWALWAASWKTFWSFLAVWGGSGMSPGSVQGGLWEAAGGFRELPGVSQEAPEASHPKTDDSGTNL